MNQNSNLNKSNQDQVEIPTSYLRSEPKNLATLYNQEATKKLEGLEIDQISLWDSAKFLMLT